ncbi:MAG TPA: DUF2269 family protein, partial [Gemmatimonadales bacterium]|nr:DUF2269 family protein [Gemmatimonadales bacterium]
MADYGLLKTLHVLGAILLVGNVTVTGVWALYLYRQRAQVPFRPVARAILWTDLFFTLCGGAMLTVTGVLLIRRTGLPWLETPWLLRGIGGLVGSTLLWLAVLLPDQWRMERLRAGDEAGLRRLFLRWSVVGWTATGLLYWSVWQMVGKGLG